MISLGVMSVEDIAAIKVAIEICNIPELKKEILCVPGSDYDVNKMKYNEDGRKQKWNEIIEEKATMILRNLGLPEKLQKKVKVTVLPAGMRMLTWAEYHEGTLGFSREYSIHFLNSSFFTSRGLIDNKKGAEELMAGKYLNIKQKYKLACLYCFTEHIPSLYRQMTQEDKKEFYDAYRPNSIHQPGLVKFWTHHLLGEVDKLKGDKNLDLFRLKEAIRSGNKTAVEYCFERIGVKKNSIVDGAREAIRNRIIANDWIIFRDERYHDNKESWIPSDYYVDIVCFLLSKMSEDQQVEFLKKDIKGVKYKKDRFTDHRRSRLLEYFLSWPYQGYFMNAAELMWDFLPERNYFILLLNICDHIEPKKENNLKYGEEKTYDYRGLLKEFWYKSPESYKRCVFSNQYVCYRYDRPEVKIGVELIIKLLTLKNYTDVDGKNIKLILDSATVKEKENITTSKQWRDLWIELIKEEKWDILDRFVLNCFTSMEEADKFKRYLSFTEEALSMCIDFVKNDNWNTVESFIKFSSLHGEGIDKLKKAIIDSDDGRYACVDLVSYDKNKNRAEKFVRWCFPSEEEIRSFKKKLVFSYEGICNCVCLVLDDQLELATDFIKFCSLSEEETKELKRHSAHTFGVSQCETLLSDYSDKPVYDEECDMIGHTVKFEGGNWEKVEKLLTWCFSSEEEIIEFKKEKLLKVSGKEIHFNLIRSSQWEEAEMFFAWLGLSGEEIKELKKETLFNHAEAGEMFRKLMSSEKDGREFVDYGSQQEAIELLLRWYLTDKEAVHKFKDIFKNWYYNTATERCRALFQNFDLAIAQRLSDLDKEKVEVKRKSEFPPPKKRFHNT